jgi:protein-glutamine gamma-glutamyltransferase
MTGRPFIGLIAAVAVEARHWIALRWDFEEDACSRAWQFCTLAIALAAVLIWLDGSRYTALPQLLSWLPPLLLPMQFVQGYGLRASLPLSSFSFLARRRRERNRRLGLVEETTHFHFGNVLFVTSLAAAAVGSQAGTPWFGVGLAVLCGWAMLGTGRCRSWSLWVVLALVLQLGFAGRIAIEKVGTFLGRNAGLMRGRSDPNFAGTRIGSVGRVELSPEIVWRLRAAAGQPVPALLRTGGFNIYIGTNWRNQRTAAGDFRDLDSRLIQGENYWLLDRRASDEAAGPGAALPGDVARLPRLPVFHLRGAAAEESLLPLPGDAAGLGEFELDAIERNTFGAVRLFPKHPVIDGAVHWRGGTNPEFAPIDPDDLRVPLVEREMIRGVVASLGLRPEDSLARKLEVIRGWFQEHFRYSRDLKIRYGMDDDTGNTALGIFLKRVRSGHCEYFATAATLMLRDLGVPARYAVGYAVLERDAARGGFVIRGSHSHAWCRLWDAGSGTWLDFDVTPSSWVADANPAATRWQRFDDAVKRVREDFFVWRNRPSNRFAFSAVVIGLGVVLAVYVIHRLWRSRRRVARPQSAPGYDGPVVRTPLHGLEPSARRLLGERPAGCTLARWLQPLRGRALTGEILDEALALHQRLRFDPAAATDGRCERLEALVATMETELAKAARALPPLGLTQ